MEAKPSLENCEEQHYIVSGAAVAKKEISYEFESATGELLQLLSGFSQEQINTVPFSGSWTGAQVGDHLLKSYGIAQTLYGPVKQTERPIDQHIEGIKAAFLNFTTKLTSPDFIVPRNTTYDKEALLSSLQHASAKISEAIQALDLSPTCVGFAFPVLGHLTRLEIAYFMICHTKRHNHQLKNIFQKIQETLNVK